MPLIETLECSTKVKWTKGCFVAAFDSLRKVMICREYSGVLCKTLWYIVLMIIDSGVTLNDSFHTKTKNSY